MLDALTILDCKWDIGVSMDGLINVIAQLHNELQVCIMLTGCTSALFMWKLDLQIDFFFLWGWTD